MPDSHNEPKTMGELLDRLPPVAREQTPAPDLDWPQWLKEAAKEVDFLCNYKEPDNA